MGNNRAMSQRHTGSVGVTGGPSLQQVTGGEQDIQLWIVSTDGTSVPQRIVPTEWLTVQEAPVLPAGWTMSADLDGDGSGWAKAAKTDTSIVLTDSTAATHTWVRKSDGGYTPPDGEDVVVAVNTDGTITFTDADGSITIFAADGRVTLEHRRRRRQEAGGIAVRLRVELAGAADRDQGSVSGRQVTLHYNHAGDSCYTGTRSAARGRTGTRRRTCCARSTARTALGPTCGTRVARLARLDDPGAEVTDFGYNTDGLLDKIRDPLVADWVAKDPAGRDSRDHPTYVATRRCCIWVNVT